MTTMLENLDSIFYNWTNHEKIIFVAAIVFSLNLSLREQKDVDNVCYWLPAKKAKLNATGKTGLIPPIVSLNLPSSFQII